MLDVLYKNAVIYTMEDEKDIYTSMGVKNGKISILSKTDEKIAAKEVVDLKGRYVFPALIDSHVHFLATVVMNCSGIKVCEIQDGKLYPDNLEKVGEVLKEKIKEHKGNHPLVAYNFVIANMKENRLPTCKEIDKWVEERPIVIYSMDGHSSSCSTSMLRLLNIDDQNHNGILYGEDHEFIQGKVTSLLTKGLTIKGIAQGLADTVNEAVDYGINCICAMEGFDDIDNDVTAKLFSVMAQKLPIDIRVFWQYLDPKKIDKLKDKMLYPRIGGCGAWELDGSVGSHTAAFEVPYLDQSDNFGKCYYSDEKVNSMVKAVDKNNYQLSVHAIGTKSINQILNAYEKILIKEKNSLCHRIDHFEFSTYEQAKRAMKLNLAVTIQPGYSWFDTRYQKSYEQFLKPEIINRQAPLSTLYKGEVMLCGSSDSPVQEMNPYLQMQGMIEYAIEGERLTIFEAFRTYTVNAAKMLREYDYRGSLAVGKIADFIIFEENPMDYDISNFYKLRPVKTYIKGREYKQMNGKSIDLIMTMFNKAKKI